MERSGSVRILAGRIADGRGERTNRTVTLRDGKIAELGPLDSGVAPQSGDIDGRDCLLLPGFIDIHIHGGRGHAVMDGTATGLSAIAAHLAQHGVTGFLATTVTGPWDQQVQAIAVAAAHARSPENGEQGAAVLGIHLEGPYINPKKKGAQPRQYILLPSPQDLEDHVGDLLQTVRVVTLAPEMPGALELIRFLAGKGIVPSIGHSDATYAEVSAGIDAGARQVTHCFNAMRPLESREPGVVGATLCRSELTAELIWDNIHVHPASCCGLVSAKGANGVILISDGIPGAGMPEGYTFSLGDLPVVVQNQSARLPDGTLAGSLLTLDQAFSNAAPLTTAERAAMTSWNAATALGLGARKGLIVPGYDADLVLLDSQGAVRKTWIAGKVVYSKEG